MPIIIFLVHESNTKLNLKIFDYDKKKYSKINQSLIFIKEYCKYVPEFEFEYERPRLKNLLYKCFRRIYYR